MELKTKKKKARAMGSPTQAARRSLPLASPARAQRKPEGRGAATKKRGELQKKENGTTASKRKKKTQTAREPVIDRKSSAAMAQKTAADMAQKKNGLGRVKCGGGEIQLEKKEQHPKEETLMYADLLV